jgi:transcriptional antiterminator
LSDIRGSIKKERGDYVNTVERRERLIQMLAMCGKTSVRILAKKLEVSERTISRDIDLLSPNNPIGVKHGRDGGYYISNYKALNLPCMKEYETELLQKIAANTESGSSCNLNPDEHQLLKDIISVYSKEGFEKRRKWQKEQDQE